MQFLHLLLGDLDLLEASLEFGKGEKSAVLCLSDHPAELVQLRNGGLVAQQNDFVNAHSP